MIYLDIQAAKLRLKDPVVERFENDSFGDIFPLLLSMMAIDTGIASVQIMLFSLYPLGVSALKVQMPALSPTMEEGNIVKWLKKEGKRIKLLNYFFASSNYRTVLLDSNMLTWHVCASTTFLIQIECLLALLLHIISPLHNTYSSNSNKH